MKVLRLRQGLLLYAPVTIPLPTSSGLEHKLPVPAMARAFTPAQLWLTPGQWNFPLSLPPSWLDFPALG
jgi:hypothetical protein